MQANGLSDRKKRILQAVVSHYVRTARPVASEVVVRLYDFPFSPATVRNIMADLEREGYLTHPYTSAGKVPTDKGYRFYVDRLMEVQRLSEEEERRIRREYQQKKNELEDIMRRTSKMLSLFSQCAAFVLSPQPDKCLLKQIELVPLDRKRILTVLVAHTGLIKHRIIELAYNVKRKQVNRISKLLNRRLSGLPLSGIKDEMEKIIQQESDRYLDLLETAKALVNEAFSLDESEVYIEGSANILGSFKEKGYDYARLASLFRAIEEKKVILDIVRRLVQSEGVRVFIGAEDLYPEMEEFSLVGSTYKSGGHVVGALGIIGPKRMEYSRMVALVDFVAKTVNDLLSSQGGK